VYLVANDTDGFGAIYILTENSWKLLKNKMRFSQDMQGGIFTSSPLHCDKEMEPIVEPVVQEPPKSDRVMSQMIYPNLLLPNNRQKKEGNELKYELVI
jgi:hypothetical protein